MINNGVSFKFKSKLWIYPGESAAWHFVTLPIEISEDINNRHEEDKRGWGSLPVKVTVGISNWKTSIFPDKKSGSFLLPIKASVRKAEKIEAGDKVQFTLAISI